MSASTYRALSDHTAHVADRITFAQSRLTSRGVDLGEVPVTSPSVLVGMLAEAALADDPASTTAEPLIFADAHDAHAVRCLLQAVHDGLGIHGLVDQGDALDYVLVRSEDADGVAIAERWCCGGPQDLDHADGLSLAGIVAAACGVRL